MREIRYRADSTTGCWICVSHKGSPGKNYPKIKAYGKHMRMNRLMAYWFHGNAIEGKLVCHSCDNPKCINPSHLWLGSNRENLSDMVNKDRQAKGERNSNSKLTKELVKLIKTSDVPACPLAEMLGVAFSTIYRIRNNKYWGHVNV